MESKDRMNVFRRLFSQTAQWNQQARGWIGNEDRPVLEETFRTPAEVLLKNYEYTKRVIVESGCEPILIRGFDRIRFVFVVPASKKMQFLRTLTHSKISPSIRIISPSNGLPEQTYDGKSFKLIEKNRVISVIRLTWYLKDEVREVYNGEEYGAEIEFWDDESTVGETRAFEDEWIAPRHNASGKRIRISEGLIPISLSAMTNFAPTELNDIQALTFDITKKLDLDVIDFPVDIVFTWVDSSDPKWMEKKRKFSPSSALHSESASVARYLNRDELRYALRSIWMFAPWVRQVFIVTDDQTPVWLDQELQTKVKVVSHTEIFQNTSHLPSFNSHAIESQIHRIDGLSEQFIYLNDDMLFGRPVVPGQFFYANGVAKHFRSQSRVPAFDKTELDTPVDQATKNSRAVLRKKFGQSQSQVFEHAPYAVVKTVMSEIEAEFPNEVEQTASARFRSGNDLNIPSHLAHYWAYLSGRSIPSTISFSYIGLAVHDVQRRLDRLENRRNVDAFCINDTFTDHIDLDLQAQMVNRFMTNYFPHAAPWER